MRRPPAISSRPAPSAKRAMPPPVLGSPPLRPLAISPAPPALLDPPLPELSPLELPLLLEPEPPEPPLLGSPPPEPSPSSEPPESSPHCSGVGLIIGQSSTGKETLASNVLSPSTVSSNASVALSFTAGGSLSSPPSAGSIWATFRAGGAQSAPPIGSPAMVTLWPTKGASSTKPLTST